MMKNLLINHQYLKTLAYEIIKYLIKIITYLKVGTRRIMIQ